MDAVNVLTVGLNTLLDDDLNSLKVASPILNKCFQGHGAAVSWGHNSFVGGCTPGPIAGYGPEAYPSGSTVMIFSFRFISKY